MRSWSSWLACVFALAICSQLAHAAPAESASTSTAPSSTSHASTSSHGSTSNSTRVSSTSRAAAGAVGEDSTSHGSSTTPRQTATPTSDSLVIIAPSSHSRQTSWSWTGHPSGSFTHHAPPADSTSGFGGRPAPAAQSNNNAASPRRGQSTVALVFEILAGAAGLFIALAVARCVHAYRRAPPRDRIGALVDRHAIQREIEELERGRMERLARALEPYRWRAPPPPYQHAPAYDAIVASDGSVDWGRPPEFGGRGHDRDRSPSPEGDAEAARLTPPSPAHSP